MPRMGGKGFSTLGYVKFKGGLQIVLGLAVIGILFEMIMLLYGLIT